MRRFLNNKHVGLFCLLFLLCAQSAVMADDLFPQYDCIAPNVKFWIDVYSRYSTSQGIVHDAHNLGVVYEIIDLKPYDAPGTREYNRARMKKAKAKYAVILNRLARNPQDQDPETRRVALLLGERAGAKDFERAADQVRCQVGQKDRFQAGLIRSGALIDEMRAIFKSNNLPEDLAYLPHVESSFNPHAYSKFGAAGMWQFMPSTGKRFMEVGYVLDERRDPIRATHAAAALLKENHGKLGSWPLAITAYNHGTNGMERAKALHGTYPVIFNSYQSKLFQFASRNFYSEFLAARHVAKNYQTYFKGLELDRPAQIHTIVLQDYISLEDICRYFSLDTQRVKAMNPALRPPVFSGQKYIPKGYALRLPGQPADDAGSTLARIPSNLYQSDQKPSRFYTVQAGDTAGKVARTHGVKLSELILANNLNPRATIFPRQTLRIPLPGEAVDTPTIPASKPAVLVAQNDSAVKKTAKPAAKPPQEQPQPKETYPQPILASVIPLPQLAPAEPEIIAPAENKADAEANPGVVAIDVQFLKVVHEKGKPVGVIHPEIEETLGHFAEWAKVRTQSIRSLNGLQFGKVLQPGKALKIPLHNTTAKAFEEARYEYHKRLQEDFFAVYKISGLQPYRIRSGETIWSLCRGKFDIPMWLLKHCNPQVDLASLNINQELMIPGIDKITANEPGVGADDQADEELPLDQAGDELLEKNVSDQVSP